LSPNREKNLWPSAEVIELFETIRKYDQTSLEYGLVSSVFVSAALELLLERVIFIMAIENFDYIEVGHLVDLLIDTYQGRMKRLQLYKRLGYGTFAEHLKEIGHKEFLKHWDEIAEIRNASVHGQLNAGQKITHELVKITISEALEVFSKLYNKFNSTWAHKMYVDDHEKDLEKLGIWKERVARTNNQE
jgi:hypothetical protein